MHRNQRLTLGLTAVLATTGLVFAGASTAQAHDRGAGPLASLVADGTLTSAERTAVVDALKADRAEGRDEHEAEKKAARNDALSSLVAAGTLTQAQADAIAAADRRSVRDLVASGIVTREQLRAVHDALESTREEARADHRAERDADISAVLASLVSKGTLTQPKADAVRDALAERPERRAGHRGGRD